MDVYIIIPFHNEEKYIESTVKSIVEQSYPVKKLLLVNDNSTDKSSSKIDIYLKRILSKDNQMFLALFIFWEQDQNPLHPKDDS